MRIAPAIAIVLCLPLLGVTGQAREPETNAPPLDPACIRFNDPNAVVEGEIVYADFTAYDAALDHALTAWSPEHGFAVSFREATPIGDAVPREASLIIRDAAIPGATFKGVTVTWTHAPATITLNRAELPPPETTDPREQELLRTVMTHETGHALGLGDVPAPGVNIRECGEMLMKRSVDKAGGRISEPQPADIALYCLRWRGSICGDAALPTITPVPTAAAAVGMLATPAAASSSGSSTTYQYFVIACERFPAAEVSPEDVERDRLPDEPGQVCVRAPAGVMFEIHVGSGGEIALTDGRGELRFEKPNGAEAAVILPQGKSGYFPSLLGYEPLEAVDRIPARDLKCPVEATSVCQRVFVLVA